MAPTFSDVALFVQVALLPLIAIAVPLVAGYPRVAAVFATLFVTVMLLVYARRRWQRRQLNAARAQTVPMSAEQQTQMRSAETAGTSTTTSDRGGPPSVERPSGTGSTRTDTSSGSEVRKPPSVQTTPPPSLKRAPEPKVFIRIPPPIENMEPTLRGLPRPADAMRRGPPAECAKVWQAMLGPGGIEAAISEHLPDVDPWMPPAPGNEPSPDAAVIVAPYALAAEAPEYPYPVQRPQAVLSVGTKDKDDAAPSPARSPQSGEPASRSGDERPGSAARDKAAKGAKDLMRMFGPLPSPLRGKEDKTKTKEEKKGRKWGRHKKSRNGKEKDASPKKEGRKSKNKAGKGAKKGSRKIDVTAAPAAPGNGAAGGGKDKADKGDNDTSGDGGDK